MCDINNKMSTEELRRILEGDDTIDLTNEDTSVEHKRNETLESFFNNIKKFHIVQLQDIPYEKKHVCILDDWLQKDFGLTGLDCDQVIVYYPVEHYTETAKRLENGEKHQVSWKLFIAKLEGSTDSLRHALDYKHELACRDLLIRALEINLCTEEEFKTKIASSLKRLEQVKIRLNSEDNGNYEHNSSNKRNENSTVHLSCQNLSDVDGKTKTPSLNEELVSNLRPNSLDMKANNLTLLDELCKKSHVREPLNKTSSIDEATVNYLSPNLSDTEDNNMTPSVEELGVNDLSQNSPEMEEENITPLIDKLHVKNSRQKSPEIEYNTMTSSTYESHVNYLSNSSPEMDDSKLLQTTDEAAVNYLSQNSTYMEDNNMTPTEDEEPFFYSRRSSSDVEDIKTKLLINKVPECDSKRLRSLRHILLPLRLAISNDYIKTKKSKRSHSKLSNSQVSNTTVSHQNLPLPRSESSSPDPVALLYLEEVTPAVSIPIPSPIEAVEKSLWSHTMEPTRSPTQDVPIDLCIPDAKLPTHLHSLKTLPQTIPAATSEKQAPPAVKRKRSKHLSKLGGKKTKTWNLNRSPVLSSSKFNIRIRNYYATIAYKKFTDHSTQDIVFVFSDREDNITKGKNYISESSDELDKTKDIFFDSKVEKTDCKYNKSVVGSSWTLKYPKETDETKELFPKSGIFVHKDKMSFWDKKHKRVQSNLTSYARCVLREVFDIYALCICSFGDDNEEAKNLRSRTVKTKKSLDPQTQDKIVDYLLNVSKKIRRDNNKKNIKKLWPTNRKKIYETCKILVETSKWMFFE